MIEDSQSRKKKKHLLRRNHRRLSLILLLLILHQLNIILLNLLILITNPLLNILTQIPLHCNNLSHTTRQLSRRTSRSKLLPQLLGEFLDIDVEGFQAGDFGDVFAFVAFDAFDCYARGG
jgi:hypothetical protein